MVENCIGVVMLRQEFICSVNKLNRNELDDFFSLAQEQYPFLFKKVDRFIFSQKLIANAEFIVCWSQEKKINGLIAFYQNNGEFTYITFVCVLKECRNKSVFSTMLQELELYAKKCGYKRIMLEVAIDNLLAQQVYRRKGFTVVEKKIESLYMEKLF